MKKEIHPGVIVAIVVVAVVAIGLYFFRAAQPAPYPGLGAAQSTMPTGGQGGQGGGQPKPLDGPVTRDEAFKRGIPGAPPPSSR